MPANFASKEHASNNPVKKSADHAESAQARGCGGFPLGFEKTKSKLNAD
jgi:hypothetical protein